MRDRPRRLAPALWLAALGVLAACTSMPPPEPQPVPVPQAEPPDVIDVPPPAVVDPPKLRIAAVGDIMLGTDFPQNILPDDDGVGFLAPATAVLTAADLTFGNLEGTLLDGGEPVKQCKDPSACYLFRTPTRYAAYLAIAGFDVMSLANNHARDFGEEGRSASMQALATAGIAHSGREGDFAELNVLGVSVGVLALAPNVGANPLLDDEFITRAVTALAARNAIVIVSFHGGAEGVDADRVPFADESYYGESRGNVVAIAHRAIDAGADLVIGHGPHVPRALELYDGRLIAYSLGNFATYYGISVEGAKGYAPILLATLNADGEFIEGRIASMIQVRPGGPRPDPEQRAYRMIRELTHLDFGAQMLLFDDDGTFRPPGTAAD